ncbi:MAG: FlgD immunoglobulin-like domain containing protein [archaeon]
MKSSVKLIIVGFFLLSCLFASEDGPFMTLKVNGHEHSVKDSLSEKIIDAYNAERDGIEGIINQVPGISRCNLGNKIGKMYFEANNIQDEINLFIVIYDNFAWAYILPIGFDLKIMVRMKLEKSDSVCITIQDAQYNAIVTSNFANLVLKSALVSCFGNLTNVHSHIKQLLGDSYKIFDPTKDLRQFGGKFVAVQDTTLEIQKLIQSVPFDVSINYNESKKKRLTIDLDFLHGYYNSSGVFVAEFANADPGIPENSQLQYVGFSPQYWGVQEAFPWWNSSIGAVERAEAVFDKISDDLNMNHCRIEAPWDKMVHQVDFIDPSLVQPITSQMVGNYLNEISANLEFNELGQIIDYARNNTGITLYIAIGQGIYDRMPLYNGKRICPGKPRGVDSVSYVQVDNSIYLYWLELYARALVRHFKDRVSVWQTEGELNGARQAEVFDYNRMGESWADEDFQTDVIETLYHAVKAEAPGEQSRTMHCFHIFNMSKRIKDWKDHYDIVGINFYPNEVMGKPVIGFMVGESVWAVRRILTSLNVTKDVWVSETAYPSYFAGKPEYTLENQQQYIKEALNSSAYYGAEAFDLLRLTDELSWEGSRYMWNFCGLVNSNGNKASFFSYDSVENNQMNGKKVVFKNMYLEENVGGFLSIPGAINGIPSGGYANLAQNGTYTAKTNSDILYRSDTDSVKHSRWNTEQDEYKISHSFTATSGKFDDIARFEHCVPLHFSDGTPDESYDVKEIQVSDPWYVDIDGKQENVFLTLHETTDTTFYPVFKGQGDPNNPTLPIYKVKTQAAVASNSSIKVFTGWEAYQNGSPVDISQNSSKIWIVSPTNIETKIVIKDANIELKPRYQTIVNTIPNYTLNIPSEDRLTIPTGANIPLASGFKFNVLGKLLIEGTEDSLVTLESSNPANTWKGFEVTLNSNNLNDNVLSLSNCIIKNATNLVKIIESVNKRATIKINNCTIPQLHYSYPDIKEYDEDDDGYIIRYRNTIETNEDIVRIEIDRCTFNGGKILAYGIAAFMNSDLTSSIFNGTKIKISTEMDAGISGNDFYNCVFGAYSSGWWDMANCNDKPVGFENISIDPLFIDASNGDYRLKFNSPCIDKGCISSPNDPDDTRADIGAYYFPQVSVSGAISTNTTWFGKITVTGDITVTSGVKLTIDPGTKVAFNSGKKLIIDGTLDAQGTSANHIIFTSSSSTPSAGSWYGIRFEDSSNDANCILKYCDIQYAQYGVYCDRANPRLISNTITNNDQGISGYIASPTITDNKITGNTDGVYFQYGSPVFYNNSIASNFFGASFYSYASPQFGPKYPESENQEAKGFNVIKENETGIIARYYSEPFMGSSDPYGYRVGGYNSVYGNSSESAFLEMDSHIEAEYNWWNNQYTFQPYAGCSIDYIPYLPSNPGGGSSLGKILSNIKQPNDDDTSGFNPRKPNVNRLSDLWLWANELQITKQTEEAINIYQILINKFPQSKEAKRSLMKIFHLYHEVGKTGLSEYLMGLTEGKKTNPELRRVAFDLLAGTYLRDGDVANAVNTYDNILVRYPGTESEKMALYNLVLVSNTDLKNSVKAGNHLQTLKSKYPNDELALLAAREMGEKVDWSLAKRTRQPEAIKQILPGKFALSNNYPNPFNPRTTIAFDLPEDSHVTLTIYDIMGREIVRLLDENQPAGFRHIVWDGKDKSGQTVSSGIYLYTLKTSAGFSETKKMALMR